MYLDDVDDLVDDYFNARNNFDEEWIANMFRVQSEKELEVIDGLTKELKKENEGLKL